jgi:hypothetical protein
VSSPKGWWLACVNMQVEQPLCRLEQTEAAAFEALKCLRQALAHRPGPVGRVLHAWREHLLCQPATAGLGCLPSKRRGRGSR